ncbi:MAG: PAS domain-containing protein [Boseongicola sp.]|nr:PAS domain-containing protein [Boseongicola sp.]
MPVLRNKFLQKQIDLISVPIFIVDDCSDDRFRVVAINSAHSTLTGMDQSKVPGHTPHELIEDCATADKIVRNYRDCIASDTPISYRETIVFGGAPMIFDTTLQKISRPNSDRFRIVGTALKIEDRHSVGSDIDFYVSLARNSMTTIELLMNARSDRDATTMSEREATLILCRKALLSLDDIAAAAARVVRSEEKNDTIMGEAVRDLLLH